MRPSDGPLRELRDRMRPLVHASFVLVALLGGCTTGGASDSLVPDAAGGGGGGGGGDVNPGSPDGGGGTSNGGCPWNGDPVIAADSFPSCAAEGHCIPASLILAQAPDAEMLFDRCADHPDSLCVPDPFIESAGNYVPPTCRSINNAEGRCLPLLLKPVKAQEAQLPQSTCLATERCVPCYNPIDAQPTGACSIAECDMPAEPPAMLSRCCTGEESGMSAGLCVPASSVPMDQQSQLAEDECPAGQGFLCAPEVFVNMTPLDTCTPSLVSLLFGEQPGVCLPGCLPAVEENGFFLMQDECPDDWKCVPCNDPTSGEPTGLCM
jgi:hypothetical protein